MRDLVIPSSVQKYKNRKKDSIRTKETVSYKWPKKNTADHSDEGPEAKGRKAQRPSLNKRSLADVTASQVVSVAFFCTART